MRRRRRDGWSLPSGRAEVELFRFWEADLAGTPQADPAGPGTAAAPARSDPEGSADPLWWATGLVFVVVVVVLAG